MRAPSPRPRRVRRARGSCRPDDAADDAAVRTIPPSTLPRRASCHPNGARGGAIAIRITPSTLPRRASCHPIGVTAGAIASRIPPSTLLTERRAARRRHGRRDRLINPASVASAEKGPSPRDGRMVEPLRRPTWLPVPSGRPDRPRGAMPSNLGDAPPARTPRSIDARHGAGGADAAGAGECRGSRLPGSDRSDGAGSWSPPGSAPAPAARDRVASPPRPRIGAADGSSARTQAERVERDAERSATRARRSAAHRARRGCGGRAACRGICGRPAPASLGADGADAAARARRSGSPAFAPGKRSGPGPAGRARASAAPGARRSTVEAGALNGPSACSSVAATNHATAPISGHPPSSTAPKSPPRARSSAPDRLGHRSIAAPAGPRPAARRARSERAARSRSRRAARHGTSRSGGRRSARRPWIP